MKKIILDMLVLWCLSILMVVQNYRLKLRLEVALCGDGVDIVDLGSNCGHSSIFGDPTIVASCHSTDASRSRQVRIGGDRLEQVGTGQNRSVQVAIDWDRSGQFETGRDR